MKILTIISSFRQDGNTARVATLLEEQLSISAAARGISLELERIHLGRLNIGVCRGCRLCFDKGEEACPLKDDLLPMRNRMAEADGLLLASPVYVEDVNGILKNWIDRLAFLCHRPALYGKCALLITTSGAGSTKHAVRTMGTALSAWGCRIAGKARFRTGALTDKKEIQSVYEKTIRMAADGFISDLMRDKDANPGWYSLIAFAVQQAYWRKTDAKAKSPYDYACWEEKGWLMPGCTYYIPIKTGRWKIGMARLMAWGIARLFV